MYSRLLLLGSFLLLLNVPCYCWGFFGHRLINQYAIYLLPPELLQFYKPQLTYLREHAVDPDKRRYAVEKEAARHYIDIDHYGTFPYDSLPRNWQKAVEKYSSDSLEAHGIVPWWTLTMLHRLTEAFKKRDQAAILKLSADIGHYIADAHVPLHSSSNHNGQKTGQDGIHGFWESRVPELLAHKEWDFFIQPAVYIDDPQTFIWDRILESAAAADTVLRTEKELSAVFPLNGKFAWENRNGVTVRQYSEAFTRAYDRKLGGMIERRMRAAILAVASFWLTAWIDAGQPELQPASLEALGKEPEPDDSSRSRNIFQLREHEQ